MSLRRVTPTFTALLLQPFLYQTRPSAASSRPQEQTQRHVWGQLIAWRSKSVCSTCRLSVGRRKRKQKHIEHLRGRSWSFGELITVPDYFIHTHTHTHPVCSRRSWPLGWPLRSGLAADAVWGRCWANDTSTGWNPSRTHTQTETASCFCKCVWLS